MTGWTEGMINVYGVELVTDPEVMDRARDERLALQEDGWIIRNAIVWHKPE